MDEHVQLSSLYVELDAILDTRLATLYSKFGPEHAVKALEHKYFTRIVDLFPNVEWSEFQTAYKARDKSVLMQAIKTPISGILMDFMRNTLNTTMSTPVKLIPHIVVNIYPYILDEDEQALLKSVIEDMVLHRLDVSLVRMSHDELTPDFVNTYISAMVMYEPQVWLEAQSLNENFKRSACPDVLVFAPMMFKKYPLTDADKQMLRNYNNNPFDKIAKVIEPFCKMVFLPVRFFSIEPLQDIK